MLFKLHRHAFTCRLTLIPSCAQESCQVRHEVSSLIFERHLLSWVQGCTFPQRLRKRRKTQEHYTQLWCFPSPELSRRPNDQKHAYPRQVANAGPGTSQRSWTLGLALGVPLWLRFSWLISKLYCQSNHWVWQKTWKKRNLTNALNTLYRFMRQSDAVLIHGLHCFSCFLSINKGRLCNLHPPVPSSKRRNL